MERRSILGLSLVVGTLILAGCTNTAPPPTPVDDDGDDEPETTFTHLTTGEARSLDPAFDYETAGGAIISNIYETLVGYAGASAAELKPVLATAMPEISEDGMEYTFTLRDGVTFHTGGTMTASDVKFSIDRLILMNDPNGPAWIYDPIAGAADYFASDGGLLARGAYLAAGGVTAVDEGTVTILLAHPTPSFTYRLAYTAPSVISQDYVCTNAALTFVNCLPPPGETRDPFMDEHEAGTGPYTLERWERGQFISLERFGDYWGTEPSVDRVIVKKVDAFNTRLLALLSGEADGIYVPLDHYKDVVGRDNVTLLEQPSTSVAFIGFNQHFCQGIDDPAFATCMIAHGGDVAKGADGLPDPDFFADEHMRMAWVYAFDYDTFHTVLTEEHGTMLNGAVPPGLFSYDPARPGMSQDVEAAKEHLALSNHPDGFEVTIFYNIGNTVREKTSNLVKQNVEALLPGDIKVNVQGLDWSTAYLPKTEDGGAAVYYLGWGADYGFPDNFLVTFGHSERGVYAKRIAYHNPELDALLDRAETETDLDALEAMYGDATIMMNEDFAYIWLDARNDLIVTRDWVRGVIHNPMSPASQDYQPASYALLSIEK